MSEQKRIISLFEKLYNGEPWIDINIVDTLQSISAIQASKKFTPHTNSIWQITNHIINWRLNVLKRVSGEVLETPNHNYFEEIKDPSEQAWLATLEKLATSQQLWVSFLETFKEEDFEQIYPNNEMTYYEHIHGIIQHDAYHLGQIVLLTKLV